MFFGQVGPKSKEGDTRIPKSSQRRHAPAAPNSNPPIQRKSLVASSGCRTLADGLASSFSGDSVQFNSMGVKRVGRRGEPAAAAGGVRGDSPVALGVPSARGRAAGGVEGPPDA